MSFRIGFGRAFGGTTHRLSLVGDVFNMLNLLDADWGVTKGVSFFETRTLLVLRDYDAVNDRGVYSYAGPDALGPYQEFQAGNITDGEARRQIRRNVFSANDIFSRWRIQLGVRYDF